MKHYKESPFTFIRHVLHFIFLWKHVFHSCFGRHYRYLPQRRSYGGSDQTIHHVPDPPVFDEKWAFELGRSVYEKSEPKLLKQVLAPMSKLNNEQVEAVEMLRSLGYTKKDATDMVIPFANDLSTDILERILYV